MQHTHITAELVVILLLRLFFFFCLCCSVLFNVDLFQLHFRSLSFARARSYFRRVSSPSTRVSRCAIVFARTAVVVCCICIENHSKHFSRKVFAFGFYYSICLSMLLLFEQFQVYIVHSFLFSSTLLLLLLLCFIARLRIRRIRWSKKKNEVKNRTEKSTKAHFVRVFLLRMQSSICFTSCNGSIRTRVKHKKRINEYGE